ncbi:MAG: MBL fold metallo-hydrolase [Dehalococcoidia bacterium]|nr:MBL fold metallo-hydrolase [Dehalococcoidia bacterium]
MNIQILGSGNAFAPDGRGWSCFLVDGRYLFDCGPQALASLKRLHVDLAGIEAVFISHFHADHWLGLPFLLLEYEEMTRRARPLEIIGPRGIEDTVRQLYALGHYKPMTRRSRLDLNFTEVSAGSRSTVAGVDVTALPMNHAKHRLEAFGFRTRIGGQVLGYTGDTSWCDEVLALGEDAAVLVADSTYPGRGVDGLHMGFDDIKRLRGKLDAETALLLTHLERAPDEALSNTVAAEDFASYQF